MAGHRLSPLDRRQADCYILPRFETFQDVTQPTTRDGTASVRTGSRVVRFAAAIECVGARKARTDLS
jgi:hypothetical protein